MNEHETVCFGLVATWSVLAAVLCAPLLVSRRLPAFLCPFFVSLLGFAVASWFGSPPDDVPSVLPALFLGMGSGGVSLFIFGIVRRIKAWLAYRGIITWVDPYEMDEDKEPQPTSPLYVAKRTAPEK
jgi:hypothetical protein